MPAACNSVLCAHPHILPQELRSRLLAEAEQSASANAAVAARWPALFHTDVPQELFAALEEQRAACEAIIGSKDALIADIQVHMHVLRVMDIVSHTKHECVVQHNECSNQGVERSKLHCV